MRRLARWTLNALTVLSLLLPVFLVAGCHGAPTVASSPDVPRQEQKAAAMHMYRLARQALRNLPTTPELLEDAENWSRRLYDSETTLATTAAERQECLHRLLDRARDIRQVVTELRTEGPPPASLQARADFYYYQALADLNEALRAEK